MSKTPDKILVIDDEPDIRDLLQSALLHHKFQVRAADSGEEGIELFRADPTYDLVLTDLVMPGLTGMDVIEKVKAIDPTIEVVVLTGHATHDTALEAMQKGAYDYLTKPMDLQELILVVKKAFERRRLMRENVRYQRDLEQLVEDRARELQQTKTFLETVLNASRHYSIIATDRDGIITLFNRGSEELLGWKAEEVEHKETVLLFTPDEARGDGTINQRKPARTSIPKPFREKRVRRKDGSELILDLAVATLHSNAGAIMGYLGIAKDVTEQKRLEEQIRQYTEELETLVQRRTSELQERNEELETTLERLNETQMQLLQSEKLASIGQLSAGVAHEINNPIGYVAGNLDALRKYVIRLRELLQFVHDSLEMAGEQFAEEFLTRWKKGKIEFIFDDLHQIIDESRDGVQRVKTIVQDLKTFSRSSGAEMAYQDLVPGLERALNIAHNEVKYKAEVVREFDEAPAVRCNMQKLEQVFVNLLVNAAQAIDEPMGTITVRLRDLANGHVELQVVDTGRGMPQEVRKKIFDPFYTTKDVGQGTGLGLSISYRIIRDHGGTINVDSEPGRGTTFSIMLPVDGPSTEPKGN